MWGEKCAMRCMRVSQSMHFIASKQTSRCSSKVARSARDGVEAPESTVSSVRKGWFLKNPMQRAFDGLITEGPQAKVSCIGKLRARTLHRTCFAGLSHDPSGYGDIGIFGIARVVMDKKWRICFDWDSCSKEIARSTTLKREEIFRVAYQATDSC